MLTAKQLDDNYVRPDPWGYQKCPADISRKARILSACEAHGPYKRALDIGCGEGWITQDLPADEIYGYESSIRARQRWPSSIKTYEHDCLTYDLVVLTGVLYLDYGWASMFRLACDAASRIIVTSHIAGREIAMIQADFAGAGFNQIFTEEFAYVRPEEPYIQRLRVFEKRR